MDSKPRERPVTPLELQWAQRIAVLETQVQQLTSSINDYVHEDRLEKRAIRRDLESLLSLKHKGAGAFWLASALAGTGIVTIVLSLVDWAKGFVHG